MGFVDAWAPRWVREKFCARPHAAASGVGFLTAWVLRAYLGVCPGLQVSWAASGGAIRAVHFATTWLDPPTPCLPNLNRWLLQAKNQALRDAGAIVPDSFEGLESAIR